MDTGMLMAMVTLVALVGIILTFASLFSEKIRSALGLKTVKRARWMLLVAVLVFFGAMQNVNTGSKDEAQATEGG